MGKLRLSNRGKVITLVVSLFGLLGLLGIISEGLLGISINDTLRGISFFILGGSIAFLSGITSLPKFIKDGLDFGEVLQLLGISVGLFIVIATGLDLLDLSFFNPQIAKTTQGIGALLVFLIGGIQTYRIIKN